MMDTMSGSVIAVLSALVGGVGRIKRQKRLPSKRGMPVKTKTAQIVIALDVVH